MKTPLITIAFVCCVSPLSAQSLGEIAAKTKAARDAGSADSQSTKTYTNTDLDGIPPVKPTTTMPVPPALDTIPAPQSEASYQAEQINRGEGYWKNRMRALETRATEDGIALVAARARLESYEATVRQSERHMLGDIYVDRDAQRRMLDAREEVSRLRAAVTADAIAIRNLEEEARHAGVPPGWLRTQ